MKRIDNAEGREFYVQTSFQKAAARPGGIPRATALRSASRNIELLEPTFASWLDNEIDGLARTASDAKSAAIDDLAWIDSVERHSERLVDVAETMGYSMVAFVASNLRVVCEAIRNGAGYRPDVITCHIDALMLCRQDTYRTMKPNDLPALAEGLRRIVAPPTSSQKS